MMEKKDSVGSMVEYIITGVPAGVGEPVFDKLDAKLAQAVMSIGAVKAIEIGDGTAVVSSIGSDTTTTSIWMATLSKSVQTTLAAH